MPTWDTLEGWARSSIQSLLQQVLEEEVTQLLGRTRYERRTSVDDNSGSRNGHGKPRRLALMSGTIEVKRPRVPPDPQLLTITHLDAVGTHARH